MWISKHRLNRIEERLADVEKAVNVPLGPGDNDMRVGYYVALLLRRFKLVVRRTYPTEELVEKGGPERGE